MNKLFGVAAMMVDALKMVNWGEVAAMLIKSLPVILPLGVALAWLSNF